MPRIVMLVINDTLTDVRLNKMALSLHEKGYEILLIGRKTKATLNPPKDINIKREYIKTRVQKGAVFYAVFNIKLFFKLLFKRNYKILWANDLDTLLAATLASQIRQKLLVYDSHELFTELPELNGRNATKKVWTIIEKMCIKKPKAMITVCKSIADYYNEKYGVSPFVIRNVPSKKITAPKVAREKLNLPADKSIVIYQGAVNVKRGIEELIQAVEMLPNVFLIIAGTGDLDAKIQAQIKASSAQNRVLFTGRLPYQKLLEYTQNADLGVSLEHNISLSYYYALPNKLFDYIRMKIPVLVNNLPEMKNIIDTYKVGEYITEHTPKAIAQGIKSVLEKPDNHYFNDLEKASEILNWENETEVLSQILNKVQS